ncbi:hypothetical protein HOLleu_13379 [Holothuria leucospilota]|uniref:Uncharacterized protein n=1 Tax=Holothuria leucospilota TaxID=206669 RepID=A0A9Q1CD60_HOLLE|nr:hypothetical protein HOLleu_13379 [Holothuria leucospilota]
MRQGYIETVKGEETFFSKDYQLEFNELTQELERSKLLSVTSKLYFPGYLGNTPGLAFVWKVL